MSLHALSYNYQKSEKNGKLTATWFCDVMFKHLKWECIWLSYLYDFKIQR